VCAEGVPGLIDRALIRVQVPLSGGQRSVPGDLPQHVNVNAGVGQPCEAGGPQVVPAEVLVAQLGNHLIPVRRIPVPLENGVSGVDLRFCALPVAARQAG
jgi:hypothetical protein